MPSTGDDSDRGVRNPPPLLAAVHLLAGRGLYGLVWIADDLTVEATYGDLVRFVAIGEPVTSSIYALVGLEEEIGALRSAPDGVVELPEVTLIITGEGRRPRANISVFWSAPDNAYILLLARTGSRSDLEVELVAQMRARLMAEAELADKTRQLERLNAELGRANADLESYASIISHDLQSPMRALRYVVDDLDACLASGAAQNHAGHYLARIKAQSRRMTDMLSALLDYSSVTRKSEAIETVDTAALVRTILVSALVPPGFHVVVEGEWPAIDTHAAPLDLVLRNLIDNAIKHHDRNEGTLRLTATRADGELLIEVADDGPGIRSEHREAIFLPFRKLAPHGGTPGQGMGLALVRRTVEGAGGRIFVESKAPAQRGTVFRVYWPGHDRSGS